MRYIYSFIHIYVDDDDGKKIPFLGFLSLWDSLENRR